MNSSTEPQRDQFPSVRDWERAIEKWAEANKHRRFAPIETYVCEYCGTDHRELLCSYGERIVDMYREWQR